MKGILVILGLLLLMMASCLNADMQLCSPPDRPIAEFRTSYFYPSSSDFRDIFRGGINYQLTGTIPVYDGPDVWARGINLWGGIDYFSKDGHSTALDDRTSVRIVPLTLGVKYFFPAVAPDLPIHFYAAGGMKYYFVHTHNDSDMVTRTINRNGMGGVLEGGLITTFDNQLLMDVFLSYSFKSFGAPSISNPAVEGVEMDVSGFNVGVGVGYQF